MNPAPTRTPTDILAEQAATLAEIRAELQRLNAAQARLEARRTPARGIVLSGVDMTVGEMIRLMGKWLLASLVWGMMGLMLYAIFASILMGLVYASY
jgi:hypothetical protein